MFESSGAAPICDDVCISIFHGFQLGLQNLLWLRWAIGLLLRQAVGLCVCK